jgi:hypothetical protein
VNRAAHEGSCRFGQHVAAIGLGAQVFATLKK